MATHKAGGSSRNGRDSQGQRRGVKRFSGEFVNAGTIIVRQVGTVFHPGRNVGVGRDWTIFSKINGIVKFEPRANKKLVSVYPVPQAQAS